MVKSYWLLGGGLVLLVIVYLLIAYLNIYRTIGAASLKASDNRHTYVINTQLKTDTNLIYVALGDSLTSGVGVKKYEESYPYLVAQKMAGPDKKITNLNFSYPGARTADLIQNLLPKAIAEQPDIVTLLIGTNDVQGGVNQSEFVSNYQFILSELTQKTHAKINVINIPFIGADTLLLPPYNFYYHHKISKFNEEIKKLTVVYKVNYIDLNSATAELSYGATGYYSFDSFHPAKLGYEIWANYIYNNINL